MTDFTESTLEPSFGQTYNNEDFMIDKVIDVPDFAMSSFHVHPTWEMYYLLSGKIRYFVTNQIYDLNPGDLIFVPKGSLHRTIYQKESTHSRFVINFSDKWISTLKTEDLPPITVISIPSIAQNVVTELFTSIYNEYTAVDKFSPVLLPSLITQLVVTFLRLNSQTSPLLSSSFVDNKNSPIAKAVRYMGSHYAEQITLPEIAAYCGFSKPYFSKRFRQEMGFCFTDYLLHLRLKKAIELLEKTKKNVTEIAFECGFNDSNYFGGCFKKVMKTSPLGYRKKMNN